MSPRYYIVVTPFFPSPNNWRGAYCYDLVKALMAELGMRVKGQGEQWKVLVFVPGAGEDYEINGIRVYRFKEKRLPSNLFPFLFHRYNERSFLNKLKEVTSTLQLQLSTSTPIVCHAHTANFAIYPLALKRLNPSVLTLLHHHDLQSFGLGMGVLKNCWLYNLLMFPILRHYHEQIDCHVFISELARKSFLSAPDTAWTSFAPYKKQMRYLPYRPVRIKRSLILYNGVDTTIFNKKGKNYSALPLQLSTPTRPFTIGCIGNFIECKDHITLIRACGILAKQGVAVKCVFIGTDVLLDTCKKEAQSIVHLHLSPSPLFEFRTELPHDQLPAFYHSVDLFVLPSYFEGFGCVYTESWCCGTPFIACKGSPMEELIADDEREKWLCNERNPEDLARCIRRYYEARDEQHLKREVAIQPLVRRFVEDVLAMENIENMEKCRR